MLEISVKGVQEGRQEIELNCPAVEICGSFPEFVDEVQVDVELMKIGQRYQLKCHAECDALLICDYSLKEFRERISAEFSVEYVFNTELFLQQQEQGEIDAFDVHAIHEDESSINITDDVVQELAVRIPLKRISPEFREKSLEDIVDKDFLDDGRAQEGRAEETWSVLKNIRIEDN
jgi:uncharacterized metal-binding protein YceD (DUF177 family)